MQVDSSDLISISDISNKGVSSLVNDAREGHHKVILRSNRPVAVIVGIEEMERLQRAEEALDDLRLLVVALARSATDSGNRVALRDVAAEAGFDLDELAAEVAAEDDQAG